MRTLSNFLIAAAVIGGLALIASPFVPSRSEVEHPQPLPACVAEDSTNCYWDADSRGNGQGRSFVNVAGVTITVSN
jgi:hypothetical protein